MLSHIIGFNPGILGCIEYEQRVTQRGIAYKFVKVVSIDGIVLLIDGATDNLFLVLVNKKTDFTYRKGRFYMLKFLPR